ncbi:MAG: carboxypeptidase PM20D1 [Phenylobacterium sp.]|jgi:carboxypeptidase PM20D1
MKKGLITIGLFIALIAAVVLLRAVYVFDDRQPKPAEGGASMTLNETQATQAAARLSEAIQIQTISYDDRSQFDAPAFLQFHQFLQNAFPQVHQVAEKTVINQYSLIYHIKGSDPTLKPVLFLGHMDVVPIDPFNRDKWSHPPFSGDISEGIVWGRGALDEKGGLMALMEATEGWLKQGNKAKRSIYLALGHDEEVGGADGAAQMAKYFADNNINFEFVLDEGGAVTEGLMQGFTRPVALLGIAEKGYANIELTVTAAGGHSSQPPPQTAVGILSQAIVNIEKNPFEPNLQFTELTFAHIGSYAPFTIKMVMANLWLFDSLVKNKLLSQPKIAASLRTTAAPTMVKGSPKSNILPTVASGVVNARIFPGESYDSVKQYIENVIDDPRVKVELGTKINPSPVSSTDSASYQLIAQSIVESDHNVLVAPYLVQGGTDSKYYYPVADNVYRFLMMRMNREKLKRLHGIDEQMPVADYIEAIEFYYRLLGKVGA